MFKIQLACAGFALILMASPVGAQAATDDRPMTVPGAGGDSTLRPKPPETAVQPDRQDRAETRRAWEEMTREWEARQRGQERGSRDGTRSPAPGTTLAPK